MTKQLVVVGSAVMTTLLGMAVLWQFRGVIAYVLISLALAAALRPLSDRLSGQSLAARGGWLLLYLVVLVGLGYVLVLAGEAAILETQQLAEAISEQEEWMLSSRLAASSYEKALIAKLPPPSQLFEAGLGDQGPSVTPFIIGLTQDVGRGASGALIILVLSIYWTIHKTHFERLWLSLLSSGQRKRARGVWRTIEPDLGAYIRGEVSECLLAGALLILGYWLLGSPYPVLLGIVGALASLVPVVGLFLAAFPVLLAGVLDSLQLGLLTAFYALAVLTVLGVWVKPLLFRRRWDNPLLTLLLMSGMAQAFGLAGLILAPPISIVCQILWSRLVGRRQVSGAASQISDLRDRQGLVGEAIQAMVEPPLPIVTSSMERLARLIEKAGPILEGSSANPGPPDGPAGTTSSSGLISAKEGPKLSTKF